MELMEILKGAVEKKASDIFIISGLAVTYKENGIITKQNDNIILPAEAENLIKEIYRLAGRDISRYEETGDDDFSVSVKGLSRFRISAYKQRGSMAAVIRVVEFDIPDYNELNIPQEIITDTVARTKGLVLVTGPAGGGKSTTLACIIDEINKQRNSHIITLEDPIEYLHKNKKSIISQREINSDSKSYIVALRACLRQSPDVILLQRNVKGRQEGDDQQSGNQQRVAQHPSGFFLDPQAGTPGCRRETQPEKRGIQQPLCQFSHDSPPLFSGTAAASAAPSSWWPDRPPAWSDPQ